MDKTAKTISKAQFIAEIKGSLDDVENYDDCINWWNSHIDAYLEDKIVPGTARTWKNPFLKQF